MKLNLNSCLSIFLSLVVVFQGVYFYSWSSRFRMPKRDELRRRRVATLSLDMKKLERVYSSLMDKGFLEIDEDYLSMDELYYLYYMGYQVKEQSNKKIIS
jgi:hypothetical protein